ncbi:hypothetical protein VHTUMSATKI_38110 [Vibrio harveyi]
MLVNAVKVSIDMSQMVNAQHITNCHIDVLNVMSKYSSVSPTRHFGIRDAYL